MTFPAGGARTNRDSERRRGGSAEDLRWRQRHGEPGWHGLDMDANQRACDASRTRQRQRESDGWFHRIRRNDERWTGCVCLRMSTSPTPRTPATSRITYAPERLYGWIHWGKSVAILAAYLQQRP